MNALDNCPTQDPEGSNTCKKMKSFLTKLLSPSPKSEGGAICSAPILLPSQLESMRRIEECRLALSQPLHCNSSLQVPVTSVSTSSSTSSSAISPPVISAAGEKIPSLLSSSSSSTTTTTSAVSAVISKSLPSTTSLAATDRSHISSVPKAVPISTISTSPREVIVINDLEGDTSYSYGGCKQPTSGTKRKINDVDQKVGFEKLFNKQVSKVICTAPQSISASSISSSSSSSSSSREQDDSKKSLGSMQYNSPTASKAVTSSSTSSATAAAATTTTATIMSTVPVATLSTPAGVTAAAVTSAALSTSSKASRPKVAKAPKAAKEPKAVKPKKVAIKDSPHVLLWICHHGLGQKKSWTGNSLRVLGVYPTKAAAENKKENVMSSHRCCGHGDILVGDSWDDEIDLVVKPVEEEIAL